MKQHSVQSDPREGDVLKFQGWKISVLRREGDQVTYRAAHRDGRSKLPATVVLSDWKERSKGSQVAERASERGSCLATGLVSAPCEVGGHVIQGETHVVDLKFFCAADCPSCGGIRAA